MFKITTVKSVFSSTDELVQSKRKNNTPRKNFKRTKLSLIRDFRVGNTRTKLQAWWKGAVEKGHGDLKDKPWWPN